MTDFIGEVLGAGSWLSIGETVTKEYWGLSPYHVDRIERGALLLNELDISPPLLEVNKGKTTLILTWSRIYDSGLRSSEQQKKDVKIMIDRLHGAGWAHGDMNDCNIISDDRRSYIIDPDTMFQIEKNRVEPEAWLIEWMKKAYDFNDVEELIYLDYL